MLLFPYETQFRGLWLAATYLLTLHPGVAMWPLLSLLALRRMGVRNDQDIIERMWYVCQRERFPCWKRAKNNPSQYHTLVAAPPSLQAHLQFFDFCPWAYTSAIFQAWPPQGWTHINTKRSNSFCRTLIRKSFYFQPLIWELNCVLT